MIKLIYLHHKTGILESQCPTDHEKAVDLSQTTLRVSKIGWKEWDKGSFIDVQYFIPQDLCDTTLNNYNN